MTGKPMASVFVLTLRPNLMRAVRHIRVRSQEVQSTSRGRLVVNLDTCSR